MHNADSRHERIAMNYGHTLAFQAAFGVGAAQWSLGKAARVLTRYDTADNADSRIDCILNSPAA